MQIKRFIRKVLGSSKAEALILESYTAVAEYIAETFLAAWEEEFDVKIFIVGCDEFAWNKYKLDSQGGLSQIEHRICSLQRKEGRAVVYRSASA